MELGKGKWDDHDTLIYKLRKERSFGGERAGCEDSNGLLQPV